MVKLSVPTSWDPNLIERVAQLNDKYKNRRIWEVYGSFQKTLTGTGRPSKALPRVSEKSAKNFIKLAHSYGIKFNFLLNAPCFGNQEFNKAYYHSLIEFLNKLVDMGVDSVTITVPYLIEIIREHFPNLEIVASVISNINSLRTALFYEELGVQRITLSKDVNRDFELLKCLRRNLKCKLQLLVNTSCLFRCPYQQYHYSILGHASQLTQNKFDDYPMLRCALNKLSDLSELIKSRWIRPEDIKEYEEIGIEYFKISGRDMPTEWILNCTEAYMRGKYEGNLFELISKKTMKPFLSSKGSISLPPTEIEIDNKKLNGFIEFFKKGLCSSNCKNCNYCRNVANEVIRVNPDLLEEHKQFLRKILKEFLLKKNGFCH